MRCLVAVLLAAALLAGCRAQEFSVPLSELADRTPLYHPSGVWLVRDGDTVRAFDDADPRNGCWLEPREPAERTDLVLAEWCHNTLYDLRGNVRAEPGP